MPVFIYPEFIKPIIAWSLEGTKSIEACSPEVIKSLNAEPGGY